jgi:hypothetical protein
MLLEDFQFAIVAYDDWLVPELVPLVLQFATEFEQWELDAIIGAQAIYASQFLNPN